MKLSAVLACLAIGVSACSSPAHTTPTMTITHTATPTDKTLPAQGFIEETPEQKKTSLPTKKAKTSLPTKKAKTSNIPRSIPKGTTKKSSPPTRTTTSKKTVTPGAFCSTFGLIGTSVAGRSYICATKAGDTKLRWRPA